MWLLFEICRSSFLNCGYWLNLRQASVPLQCLPTANSLIRSCGRIGEIILKQLLAKASDKTAAVHYFQKQPPELFCKKGVLKKFANFIGKHLRACNTFKKKLQHRRFPVKFAKFLRTPILMNIGEGLLLLTVVVFYHLLRNYQTTIFQCTIACLFSNLSL